MTGYTPEQRAALISRDGGKCALEHLGACDGPLTAQHRKNRGMGGRRSLNTLANGAVLCWSHNTLAETDAAIAAEARRRGVKLADTDEPAEVPQWSPFWGQMTQPLDDQLQLLGAPYTPREN